jgi:hypothetical protein
MIFFGWHNMTDAVAHYFQDHVTPDRDNSLLLLDSILLIPLIFAVFFYPVEILVSLAVVAAIGVGLVALSRALHRHRARVGH